MTFLPIVDRELSVTSRRPGTYWLRFWAALAVLAIWLFLLNTARNATPARLGVVLLDALGILTLGFSLFAGAFLTADCLSEEKREGTLGLLFLTDLKSYDVVLGKLAASSLNAFFGLLATFPILGLTILLGGVSGREFARLMLVFAVTLFFSLGIGMFVSAVSHEARQALGRAFFLIVVFAGLCPLCWWGEYLAFGAPTGAGLLLPSPVFAYMKAFDAHYAYGNGPLEFWLSVAAIFAIGLTSVLLAICLLPRAWRRVDTAPVVKSKRPGHLRASRSETFPERAPYLEANPYHWLTARDRAGSHFALRILLLLLPVWGIFLGATLFVNPLPEEPFIIALFIAFGLHVLIKVLMATEASRRMNQDRQSGALELLMATHLTVDAILLGQRKALARHYAPLVLALVIVNMALCAMVRLDDGPLHMGVEDKAIFTELFVGGAVVLVTDFIALIWVGMWRGLNARKHSRAVVGTLGRIMVPSWLGIFLLIFSGPRFSGRGDVELVFALWFALGVVVDLVAGLAAHSQLRTRFRELASQHF